MHGTPPQLRTALLLLMAVCATSAFAHHQPTTLIALDVAPTQVTMRLHLPLTELELAFGNAVSQHPETILGQHSKQFERYLLQHIRPATDPSQPWHVQVLDVSLHTADQTQEAAVSIVLTPPAGASTRHFTLNYDVILHQVVTHKALVSIRKDWEGGLTQGDPVQIGVLRVNTETTRIDPLVIHLQDGSWRAGIIGMVSLGMHHISEGADHLLFLLVLLLPATLVAKGSQWGDFGGSPYSLIRLLRIVTAFTLGHSFTLLAGAFGWIRLPQQPVEILIALSILVSAIHAIRPLFPGRENYVAASFGLIHGLAFASGLADLQLSTGPLALSIFGFNLGIELMQLFVLAVTVPWFIVLSLTPFYKWIKNAMAFLAAVAALGWIANRVSGETNAIVRALDAVIPFAPMALLLLALIAISAYFGNQMRQQALSTQTER